MRVLESLQRDIVLLAGCALVIGLSSAAMADTWVGNGGDANWNTGDNWQLGAPPTAGASLIFQGDQHLINNNDFAAGTQFNGIHFAAGAGAFQLGGSAINLGGNISSDAAGTQTIGLGLTLLGDTQVAIFANDNTSRITLDGDISGDYGLTMSGTEQYGNNRVTLSGANSYTGLTTVGTVGNPVTGWINDPGALPGDVTVVTGSTLRLRPTGASTTFANNIGISGIGVETIGGASWQARDFAGALVLTNNANVTGTVTLLGDSRISANRDDLGTSGMAGTISGQITGDYALQFGFVQERPGTITITNPDNDWTGDTFVTGGAATNSSGRVFTLRLGAPNVLPSGAGFGNLIINTNNTRVDTLGNDQNINGLFGNNSAANLLGGGSLTLGNGDADGNYPGNLTVNNLIKTGTGPQILRGRTNISGSTTVNDGLLQITGGLATLGAVTVNGGNLELAGGTFGYNSATDYSGAFTFTSGTLQGTNWQGGLSGLTIGAGQVIAPGSSPGAAVTDDQTWASAGTFQFEINDANGDAGVNWDHLMVNNVLDIAGLSSANPFVIQLVGPADSEGPTPLVGFDAAETYDWQMVAFGSMNGIFSSDLFFVDITGFGSDLGEGFFEVQQHGNTLTLSFVPEPASLALVGLGGLILLGRRRHGQ